MKLIFITGFVGACCTHLDDITILLDVLSTSLHLHIINLC